MIRNSVTILSRPASTTTVTAQIPIIVQMGKGVGVYPIELLKNGAPILE